MRKFHIGQCDKCYWFDNQWYDVSGLQCVYEKTKINQNGTHCHCKDFKPKEDK